MAHFRCRAQGVDFFGFQGQGLRFWTEGFRLKV